MTNRALLIGINRYKILGADLRGCVNDMKNMQSVLTQYRSITVLSPATSLCARAWRRASGAAICGTVSKFCKASRHAAYCRPIRTGSTYSRRNCRSSMAIDF